MQVTVVTLMLSFPTLTPSETYKSESGEPRAVHRCGLLNSCIKTVLHGYNFENLSLRLYLHVYLIDIVLVYDEETT